MLALVAGCAAAPPRPASSSGVDAPAPRDAALERLRADARALAPLAVSPLARAFLAAAEDQPPVAPRVVWTDPARRAAWSDAQAAVLPAEARARLVGRVHGVADYWDERYGSPLAYVRALDVLAAAGLGDVAGRRVVDLGYGQIGAPRLLATLGAEVVGVDVDPLLPALYALPSDTGRVGRGRLALVSGLWPAQPAPRAAVGDRVDLFLSKNTLKRGYVHPEYAGGGTRHFDLGADDASFLTTLHETVAAGGWVLLYNVCPGPAPAGATYVPWADGRSPFERPAWEAAGFRLEAFDRDDTPAIRAVARVLKWNEGDDPTDIDHDLFATYTLARR
jgi:hypothetical protein